MKLSIQLIDCYSGNKQVSTHFVDSIDESRELLDLVESEFSGYLLNYTLSDDLGVVDNGSIEL